MGTYFWLIWLTPLQFPMIWPLHGLFGLTGLKNQKYEGTWIFTSKWPWKSKKIIKIQKVCGVAFITASKKIFGLFFQFSCARMALNSWGYPKSVDIYVNLTHIYFCTFSSKIDQCVRGAILTPQVPDCDTSVFWTFWTYRGCATVFGASGVILTPQWCYFDTSLGLFWHLT